MTNGTQTYALRGELARLQAQMQTIESAASSLNTNALNTQILFRDGTAIAGSSAFTYDKVNQLLTIGFNTSSAVPARRIRAIGTMLVDAGDNNPNGVSLRVIGNIFPYHNMAVLSGLVGGFASNADHSHLQWQNLTAGLSSARFAHQELYTVSADSGGIESFVNHAMVTAALGFEFPNELSFDTTGTAQNPAPDAYIGRVIARYSANPGITLGENLILQILNVPVAGIQAANYSCVAVTASTLVGSVWEVQVDVYGLDPLHWNWNNRANTPDFNGSWSLWRPTNNLTGFVSVEPVVGDDEALDITWSAVPAQLLVGRAIGFLIKGTTNLTGLIPGKIYPGYVTKVTGLVTRVRLRNTRYRFSASIGGAIDSDPTRYNVYPGVADVPHEPTPSHSLAVQYRQVAGLVTNVLFGTCDIKSTVDKSVTMGLNLLNQTSNSVMIGTDMDTNVMTLTGNVLSINGVSYLSGTGSPAGVVSAPVGSIYTNKSGGAGTTLYVKESGGTGNTGWVAK